MTINEHEPNLLNMNTLITAVKTPIACFVWNLMVCGTLLAQPVGVSYSVSGTSGDYTLDFTIQNNLPATDNLGLYWFGVYLSANDITGTPTDWPAYFLTTFNTSTDHGPNINFNNIWFDTNPGFGSSEGFIPSGSSLSGFDVHISDATLPTSVPWFAYAYPDNDTGPFDYDGGQSFNPLETYNPGFAGVIRSPGSSVADGGFTLSLLGFGVAGLGAMKRELGRV
jgi:hypothetical protein